ncbi:MAG: acyltransferase [Patulibacter minatonensis]
MKFDPYALGRVVMRLLWALPPLPIPRALVNVIVGNDMTPMKVRWLVLTLYGVRSRSWIISERCFFGGHDITIGHDSGLNLGVWFDNAATITIGDRVRFGPQVQLITSNHPLGGPDKRCAEPCVPAPIVIEDGVWITAGVIIGPGVTVGKGSVVAMGSVVTKDLPPHGYYAGSPAKLVKRFDDAPDEAETAVAG